MPTDWLTEHNVEDRRRQAPLRIQLAIAALRSAVKDADAGRRSPEAERLLAIVDSLEGLTEGAYGRC